MHEPLRGMARGELAIDHATFDRQPSPRTAMHLRELFIRHGLLEPRDRFLLLFQQWLDRKLATVSDPEHRRRQQLFATWHHLRRLRDQAAAGALHNGPVHTAKQEITVAAQFLGFLADRGRSPATSRQADVDAWLATGPTTQKQRASLRTLGDR